MATCRHGDDAGSCPTCIGDARADAGFHVGVSTPRTHDARNRPVDYGREPGVIVAKCPTPSEVAGVTRFAIRTGVDPLVLKKCVCGEPLAREFRIEAGVPSPAKPEMLEHAAP